MSMYQKAKDKALEVNDKIDGKVDAKVEKVKQSRFTWLILGGAALLLAIIFVLLARY